MNTPIFTCVKRFTKPLALGLAISFAFTAQADWKIDFSRRTRAKTDSELGVPANPEQDQSRAPASVTAPLVQDKEEEKKGLLDALFDAGEPVQDIVILNTDRGFVPPIVRVRKGGHYRIHVVNVNEKEKNVSFILDGFSEHHATYYGKIKTFTLEPRKEGSYSFQSPETSSEGRMIVFDPQMSLPANMRAPASAGADESK